MARAPDRPDYTSTYRTRHRALTIMVTNEEYDEIAGQGEVVGLRASTYAKVQLLWDCIGRF